MSLQSNFNHFIQEAKRVLRATRKPSKQEFWTVAKVSAIGILIIGFIGATIQITRGLLF